MSDYARTRVLATLQRMPTYHFDLVYIDRSDQLSDDAVSAYLADPADVDYAYLTADLDEWAADRQHERAGDLITEACELTDDVDPEDLTDDDRDVLRTFIYERDMSDPIGQLARNTPRKLMRMTIARPDRTYSLLASDDYRAAVRWLVTTLTAHGLRVTDAYRWARDVMPECGDVLHNDGWTLDVIWSGELQSLQHLSVGSRLTFTDASVVLFDRGGHGGMDAKTTGTLTLTVRPDSRPVLDSAGEGYGWDAYCGLSHGYYRSDPVVSAPELTVAHLQAIADAAAIHGRNAAGWVFDGNTSAETFREYRRMSDDGDPELYDRFPSGNPLSGEWADDPTVRTIMEDHTDLLSGQSMLTDDDDARIAEFGDDVAVAYEQAYSDAFYAELDRVAALHTGDDDA